MVLERGHHVKRSDAHGALLPPPWLAGLDHRSGVAGGHGNFSQREACIQSVTSDLLSIEVL
eukprot:756862-Amphidinium_carterae.1